MEFAECPAGSPAINGYNAREYPEAYSSIISDSVVLAELYSCLTFVPTVLNLARLSDEMVNPRSACPQIKIRRVEC